MKTIENFQIYGLHEAGDNQTQIATQLGISPGQVGYSLRRGSVSPNKWKGISMALKADDIDQIISYIGSSSENNCRTFLEFASGSLDILVTASR